MESVNAVRQAALLLRAKIDKHLADLTADRVIELALADLELVAEQMEPGDPVLAGGSES